MPGRNEPRLNRAEVRMLKRRLALAKRLTIKALSHRYGLGRKALWAYARGQTLPFEDWQQVRGRPYCQQIGRYLDHARERKLLDKRRSRGTLGGPGPGPTPVPQVPTGASDERSLGRGSIKGPGL